MADLSQDKREQLAKEGKALPDGSFPIRNRSDLDNAIKLAGNASNPARAKRFIKKRARELGETEMIPDTWN